MNIPKSRADWFSVLVILILGAAGNALWEGSKWLVSAVIAVVHVPYVPIAAVFEFLTFVLIALIGVSLGRMLERSIQHVPATDAALQRNLEQSQSFVLEVDGSQPLDGDSDWRFLITNCTAGTLRYVQLSRTRSKIGAYEIDFKEIPILTAGQKQTVNYEVFPRRSADVYSNRKATLWNFALDFPAGEGATTYIWYDVSVQYRDDDNSVRDGGLLGFCFDLEEKKLKTEGAEYYRKHNYRTMFGMRS